MFTIKFLDGTPVPNTYMDSLSALLSGVAESDPGELGEVEIADELVEVKNVV
jgi:hypothetical protein